jgi:hypothetical protein
MRVRALVVCVLLAGCAAHPRAQQDNRRPESLPPAAAPAARPLDFTRDVRPILESRCRPCHFEGGRMYDSLPFDRAETIRRLGTRLFTRIKAEDEQALIRRFLAQAP